MSRAKKDGRRVNYYLYREVYEAVEMFAVSRRYPMTAAIEILLEKGLEAEAKERGFQNKEE